MAGKSKFYTVWEGRRPGVYATWDECKKQIDGYPNAKYKSFPTKKDAELALSQHHARHIYKKASSENTISSKRTNTSARPSGDCLCVDAACSGNPGRMEYRGVELQSGDESFRMGPYEEGTNNVGEFLAIVHALALLKKQGHTHKQIYSDSKIAIGWIKKKKCGTKLEHNRKNSKLFDLIHRAELWLQTNQYANPILKWETEDWGEIPADFGRK